MCPAFGSLDPGLLLAYQPRVADGEECHRRPAQPGRRPAADDPAQAIDPPKVGGWWHGRRPKVTDRCDR